jgi:glutaredoxin
MKITLYRKAGCPWSAAVMGFLNELNIPFEIKNVTSNPAYAEELKAASGQCMSPSVDFDGTMLADASVGDVAQVLEQRGLII